LYAATAGNAIEPGRAGADVWRQTRSNEPEDPWAADDPALALALQQLRYYAVHRARSRWAYRTIEFLLLLLTAITTVVAALKAPAWITATLAAGAVVVAGLNRILDAHESWIAYGSAWAELEVAVNDYRLLPAGQQDDQARARLMAKVNEVIRADTDRWATRRRGLAESSDGHR
jgi:hypothetical protein